MKKMLAMAIVACALLAQPASAAVQPPANAFITFGGLDWAQASPCHSGAPSCGSVIVPNRLGWRYATAAEWGARPAVAAFLDAGGNYTGTGGLMRCASPYFASGWTNCDYQDALAGLLSSGATRDGPGVLYNGFFDETRLVRGDTVPEPASIALMGTGLLGLFGISRRRKVA